MSNSTPPTAAPASCYPDPSGAAQHRYWDGHVWSEQMRRGCGPDDRADLRAETGRRTPGRRDRQRLLDRRDRLRHPGPARPLVFGPIALILGAVGKSNGEAKAATAMVVAGVGMVIGALVAMATL